MFALTRKIGNIEKSSKLFNLLQSNVAYYNTKQEWRQIEASINSMNTINPIRKIIENLSDFKMTKDREFISLGAGDPTKYIQPPSSIKLAIENALNAPNTINSYCNSTGLETARVAISKFYHNCDKDDVKITCGGQGALDLLFLSLCNNHNDHILLPSPGYPEYETNLKKYGFGYKYYQCLPDKEWRIDCDNLESLITENTKGILTNSPSNPCGSILDYDTMLNVLHIANKYKIPIISDEIYSNIVFPGNDNKFISYSEIKKKEGISVPIMIVSGLAKNYLLPGWKVGWIVFDDNNNDNKSLEIIKQSIFNLTQVNYGPSSLCQSMIADILDNTQDIFWKELNEKLYENSKLFSKLINDNIGDILHAIPGRGAFYMMIKINFDKLKNIGNDYEFYEKFLTEQAVLILPGSIFKMDGFFRAVICSTNDTLIEVAHRLKEFCDNHRV